MVEGKNRVLPWARRTRVGRRNLPTTASNGSANGLQVISDRLADNFSILPGHHGSGDNVDDGDGDGKDGADDDGAKAEADGSGGGALKSESFAMFECPTARGERSHCRCARAVGGRARPLSLSVSVVYLPLHRAKPVTLVLCGLTLIWRPPQMFLGFGVAPGSSRGTWTERPDNTLIREPSLNMPAFRCNHMDACIPAAMTRAQWFCVCVCLCVSNWRCCGLFWIRQHP